MMETSLTQSLFISMKDVPTGLGAGFVGAGTNLKGGGVVLP